jgi:putative transposase
VRGYDAGKKVTGRKRHIAVDIMGLALAVVVHWADMQDQDGAKSVFECLQHRFSRLKVIFADSAYGRSGLPEWVMTGFGWILQTVLRPVHAKGFVFLPKRWIVERTFAWLGRSRRHSKDYERTTESSEAMIQISMIHLMTRRLACLTS